MLRPFPALLACLLPFTAIAADQPPPVPFRNQQITGIGREPGVCRRDPSDVVEVGGKHYAYYTEVETAHFA